MAPRPPRSPEALAPVAAGVVAPAGFPARPARPSAVRIEVALSIGWPAASPPVAADLPALRRFLEMIRDLATAGIVRASGPVDAFERALAETPAGPTGGTAVVAKTASSIREGERVLLVAALGRAGTERGAAAILGVSQRTVRNMIRRHGVQKRWDLGNVTLEAGGANG